MSDSYAIARSRVRRKAPKKPLVAPMAPLWAALVVFLWNGWTYGLNLDVTFWAVLFGFYVLWAATDLWLRWRWRQWRAWSGQESSEGDPISAHGRAMLRWLMIAAALMDLVWAVSILVYYGPGGLLPR